ncbi:hypothetical protein BC938DRAFT_483140 [Jimgerdemannia flammicorona]|uniref:F-box domain-containing protein n=1 Tax=Jimgerdemannia flammicorona TaxID=994334 RepID=A0A433QCM5_9FUNG|nr:hypothetical protein BC938DRAFT_483140 [Jimgerdemannia flammicorona]
MTSPTLPFEIIAAIFKLLPEEDAIGHCLIRTDLFNCSLVSRDWRAIALPILWKEVRFGLERSFDTYDDVSILNKEIWLNIADLLVDEYNEIDDERVCALAKALKMNTSLRNLKLYVDNAMHIFMCSSIANDIGEKGASALAEALEINTSLQNLDISDNHILSNGAISLAEVLKMNVSLQSLNLEHNGIADDGASAIAEALKMNTNLQNLNLAFNYIGDKGIGALVESLKTNRSLQNLDLSCM